MFLLGEQQFTFIHSVPKTATLFFGHNFCEYKPIFKVLSPTDSPKKMPEWL